MRKIVKIIFPSILIALLVACGGGGGGGSSSSDLAANVEIAVSPGVLDTGDRTTVTVYIDSVNEDGAVLKVRFPIGLRYIIGTSEINTDGEIFPVAPTTSVSDEKNSYLVYYLKKRLFGDSSATLTLKLLGTDNVAKGAVEVDADLNDPQIDDQDEFAVATPNFDAQGSDGIVVNG